MPAGKCCVYAPTRTFSDPESDPNALVLINAWDIWGVGSFLKKLYLKASEPEKVNTWQRQNQSFSFGPFVAAG